MEHTLDLDALRDQIVNECMRRIGEKQPVAETVSTETEETKEDEAQAKTERSESADASSEQPVEETKEERSESADASSEVKEETTEAKEDSSAEEVIKAEALNSAAETAPTVTGAMKQMDEWRKLKGEDLIRWCRRHPEVV